MLIRWLNLTKIEHLNPRNKPKLCKNDNFFFKDKKTIDNANLNIQRN